MIVPAGMGTAAKAAILPSWLKGVNYHTFPDSGCFGLSKFPSDTWLLSHRWDEKIHSHPEPRLVS